MKKYKVIQVVDDLGWGGVSSFIYDLAQAIHEQGIDITIISLVKNDMQINPIKQWILDSGVRIMSVGAPNRFMAFLYFPKLRKIIKKISSNTPTICNLHLKLGVLVGTVATLGLKNVYRVETYHNSYHHYWLQNIVLSPMIKKYICVSEVARQEMHIRFRTPLTKVVAIQNGINRRAIRANVQIEKPNKVSNTTKFISVGRLSWEKNLLVSTKASTEICSEKIEYMIIGDGPQKEEIIKTINGNSYIKLKGYLPRGNIFQELVNADALIMPSLWEGLSILMLESMALDRPMILSDIPSFREVLGEDSLAHNELYRKCKWGYLVKTNEIDGYKAAMCAFAENATDWKKIQETVSQISIDHDISVTASKYLKQYEEVISM